MTLSTRYGLVGIGALALLSLVHWGRKMHYAGPDLLLYLMGVLPNVAAAIAIPFVLLSIFAEQKPCAGYPDLRRTFVVLLAVAGLVLIAWEIIQQSSRALVLDPHDIGATIFGLGIGWALFVLMTPATGRMAQGANPDTATPDWPRPSSTQKTRS